MIGSYINTEHKGARVMNKFDKRYLEMACVWAKNSYAIRRKVGCLIVKDNMIISDGYNGTPSGFPNVCEDRVFSKEDIYCKGRLVTKPYVLHAEANAITKLAKSNNSSIGATLYVTCEPCMECAKLIIQSGIKRVVYMDDYRIHDGINLLKAANIEVEQIKEEELYEEKTCKEMGSSSETC